jgi:hypothetical protein
MGISKAATAETDFEVCRQTAGCSWRPVLAAQNAICSVLCDGCTHMVQRLGAGVAASPGTMP